MASAGPSDMTVLEKKIVRQIEYYFGDFNLPGDKFINDKLQQFQGWMPIDILMRFNRLESMSKDKQLIVGALKKAASPLLELSADGEKVRRKPDKPAPKVKVTWEFRRELDERSIYAEGFPLEATLDDLLEFFDQFGQCTNVFMRQRDMFEGSVFASFATREEAAAFLAREGVKFQGQEITREWRTGYEERKLGERDEAARREWEERQEAARRRCD